MAETARVVVMKHDELDGWIVDIHGYEALGLYDTSSRYFAIEAEARMFADELAALLILDKPVDVEFD